MTRAQDVDTLALARRGLLVACVLTIAGAAFALVFGVPQGTIAGTEIWLNASSITFSTGVLVALAVLPLARLPGIALTATVYFLFYLCAGVLLTLLRDTNNLNIFAYLLWFFPLLAFNRFVNPPATARKLGRALFLAPPGIVALAFPRLESIFPFPILSIVVIFCFAYACFAIMLATVSRYREAYIAVRQRSESFKITSRILDSISDCFLSLDGDGRLEYLNVAACAALGVERNTSLGNRLTEIAPAFGSIDVMRGIDDATRSAGPTAFEAPTADGKTWYAIRCFPQAEGLSVYFRDITAQRRVEEALRKSETLVQMAGQIARMGGWSIEIGQDRVVWSDEVCAIYERPPGTSPNFEEAMAHCAPEFQGRVVDLIVNCGRHGTSFDEELEVVTSSGKRLWVRSTAKAERNAAGQVMRIVGALQDISERKRTEDQLRQSQKLEAVGQLTGGVAHDFNNLLTVIIGNAETLAGALSADDRLRRMAEMARVAAERGASLTHRLLAFARQQALEPKAVDVASLIAGMGGLLKTSLGEAIHIEVGRTEGLWAAFVDAPQLEAALLNLAINARDAMPDGGTLRFEMKNIELDARSPDWTGELTAGPYVAISVDDTGTGMTQDVLARAFEPFFTTKDVGKGSGLGLSMVHGFVRQSGGHVCVSSEPGRGTSVRLYLPKSIAADDIAGVMPTAPAPASGVEKLLMVEDDELVREHVSGQLRDLGYDVTAVADGPAALDALKQDSDFDLLFTDVVMPGGMNGRQVADAAWRLHPNLVVLFTTGYTEDAIVRDGRVEHGVQLLKKPYKPRELAAKIRQVLDSRRPSTDRAA